MQEKPSVFNRGFFNKLKYKKKRLKLKSLLFIFQILLILYLNFLGIIPGNKLISRDTFNNLFK